jgi:hypothetical protein
MFVDTARMRVRLEAFKRLCEMYAEIHRSDWSPEHQRITDEAIPQMPTVRRILNTLEPGLGDQIKQPQHIGGMSHSLRAVQEGLGILDDWDEWAVRLTPEAPSLVVDQFHHHVWRPASALWDTGQFRVAVQQACVSLSAHIAVKAGSSLTERALVSDVFSPNSPRPGQTRLHLPGDKTTATWRNRQDGLHLIAQGAFAGIRNVATHTPDEWSEQIALEHLAVLSLVAHWADETEVVTG